MKKNKILNIILITSALILTGVLGWLLFCNNTASKIEPIVKEEPINKEGVDEIFDIASAENTHLNPILEVDDVKYLENGEVDTSDWIQVKNTRLGIKFLVPPFLDLYGDEFGRNFYLNMEKDNKLNYDYQFGRMIDLYNNLTLEEKDEQFSENENEPGYKKMVKGDSILIFNISYSKDGYIPIANFLIENGGVSAFNYLYSKDKFFSNHDSKYLDVFNSILKSFETLQ